MDLVHLGTSEYALLVDTCKLFDQIVYSLCLFSGASKGLSLTLNIEQYEYMRGPHLDAGVKVKLYFN